MKMREKRRERKERASLTNSKRLHPSLLNRSQPLPPPPKHKNNNNKNLDRPRQGVQDPGQRHHQGGR